MAMQQKHSVEDMVETLTEVAEDYSEQALVYNKIERKWRSFMFRIAIIMGVLPIIGGAATMLPEALAPWFALGVSLMNVMIVIVNTKMDMGERIADAAMAGKGYEKLSTNINFMLTEVKMGKDVDITENMVQNKAIIDNIKANISYPEGKPKPGLLMGILVGMCPCLKKGLSAGKTLSKVNPANLSKDALQADAMAQGNALKDSASAQGNALKDSATAQGNALKDSATAQGNALRDTASAHKK